MYAQVHCMCVCVCVEEGERVCLCWLVKGLLAALAGLDLHIGELLYFGGLANVIEDGEGLQVLGDAAGQR